MLPAGLTGARVLALSVLAPDVQAMTDPGAMDAVLDAQGRPHDTGGALARSSFRTSYPSRANTPSGCR